MQLQEKTHELAYQQSSERKIIHSRAADTFSLISLSTDRLTANDRTLDIFTGGRSIGVCHSRGRNRARGYYRDPVRKLRRSTLT